MFRKDALCCLFGIALLALNSCTLDTERIITEISDAESEYIDPSESLTLAEEYFLDISLGSEFGNAQPLLRKWTKDMKIYVVNKQYEHLNEELDLILEQINGLSESITIYTVDNAQEANFIIYFGDKDTYVQQYEPSAANYVSSNFGLVWIYWTGANRIVKGSMYVDVFRVREENCQKHLLREELTQALGLLNDSYQYDKSIFYQNWTCTPSYMEIDQEVIKYVLHPLIEPGMDREEATEMLLTIP